MFTDFLHEHILRCPQGALRLDELTSMIAIHLDDSYALVKIASRSQCNILQTRCNFADFFSHREEHPYVCDRVVVCQNLESLINHKSLPILTEIYLSHAVSPRETTNLSRYVVEIRLSL